MARILVAGATGHLGRYVAQELAARGYAVRALGRDAARLGELKASGHEAVQCDLLAPASLTGVCEGVEAVFSAAGASVGMKIGDRRSYRQVDYGGNLNLLREAEGASVKKFVYVSLFGADKLAGVEYADAHEQFVAALKASGLVHTVIRPTGFFSAFAPFVKMAQQGGKGLVIGSGECRTNPIHEADLAAVCADAIEKSEQEIPVGGPQTFTRRRIVEMAFEAVGKPPRTTSLPPRLFRLMIAPMRLVNPRMHALMTFAAAVSQIEAVAPAHGRRDLQSFFAECASLPK